MYLVQSIILCGIAGVVGAVFSMKSAQGGSSFWPVVSGLMAVFVWTWMTKQPLKPWVAAVLFDGVYGLSWLLALVALGERPSWYAIVGAGMVLTGLALAGQES